MPTSFETTPRPIAKPSDNLPTESQTGAKVIQRHSPKTHPGRLPPIDEEKIAKLERCFRIGTKVEEALSYAGVSGSTFYRRCKDDLSFRERMRAARAEYFVLLKDSVAKQAIVRGDGKLAHDVLKSVQPDVYGKEAQPVNVTQFFQQTNIYTTDRAKLDELSTQELMEIANAPAEVIEVEPKEITPLEL